MKLVVWKSDCELSPMERGIHLSLSETLYYESISSESRRCEWLTSRQMVRSELGENVSTIYIDRRPSLVGSDKHISISHSDKLVVLMISDVPCGVDIENSKRDFSRVSKRFLSIDELSWMNDDDVALAWSIKEAAYKMIGVADIDFATMFLIRRIDRTNSLSILTYNEVEYQLSITSWEQYNIVYGEMPSVAAK